MPSPCGPPGPSRLDVGVRRPWAGATQRRGLSHTKSLLQRRPGVYKVKGSELQDREHEISAACCVVREATVPQERLACGRTRVLAAMREATVVPVCNTAMKSKASAVIERSSALNGAGRRVS